MQSRRYIFIDYEDLINIKFKKLEKICTRIFIFVNSERVSVPMNLVQQMQKMGKDIKWITIENANKETSLHISFLMGKLHEKVSIDIEFAILSNEDGFDPLVNFINNSGRNCLRVKQKMANFDEDDEDEDEINVELIEEDEDEDNWEMENDVEETMPHFSALEEEIEADFKKKKKEKIVIAQNGYDSNIPYEAAPSVQTKTAVITKPKKQKKAKLQAIENIAEETIRRLIRSGNRPSEISMLKSYILLHHQDENEPEVAELVIDHMTETKDIRFEEEEVIYNF